MNRSYLKRKGFKKVKIPTAKSEKDLAWKAFSIFIRTRDCLKTTGTLERGKCFTCDKYFNLKELQAGHLVAGRTNAVLFDEEGVKAQCERCNIHKYGQALIFRSRLVRELGEQRVELIEAKRCREQKYYMSDYTILKNFYIEKTKQLKECAK